MAANDVDFSSSPRKAKRVKTDHDPHNNSPTSSIMLRPESTSSADPMDESIPDAVMPLLNQSHSQANASYDSLSKEAECGITEFVSPDLFGFTGILKKRYTDFLVNEILPSGIVVHLDSLARPSGGKQVDQTKTAKPTHSKLVGDALNLSSIPSKPVSATEQNDNIVPETVSHLSAEQALSSGDEADGGVMITKTSMTEHGSISENQASISEKKPLEMGIPGNTRRTEKVLLRQTSSGLVEVTDQNEAKLLLAKMKASHNRSKDEVSEQGPPGAHEPLLAKDGHQEDKETRQEPMNSSPSQWQAFAQAPKSFQLALEDRNLLISYFDMQVVNEILALYERVLNSPLRKATDYGIVESASIIGREARTNIHQLIRRVFDSHLETLTNDDGTMTISAAGPKPTWTARTPTKHHERGRKPFQKGKPGWKELGGDHLHFTLYKENKDTMEVISYLAKQLQMKPQAFQFAGTKDRRGITAQRVSVYRVFADRIIKVGRTLKNAKIGNYEYQPHGLQLGDLAGNEFVITLRDCSFGGNPEAEAEADLEGAAEKASKIVKSAIENLKDRGFINYYGLQRFGTFSTRTDIVGLKILQGDFKAAVEAILDYNPASLAASQDRMPTNDKVSKDDMDRAYAINLFQTSGKSYPALDKLPRKFSAEMSIIRHLSHAERSTDFQGALQTISRNLRMMYVHAYQSLVWNIAASERWKRFGNQTLEGDLVLVNEHKDKVKNLDKLDEIDVDGEIIVHPVDEDRAGTADDIFTRARALTKDEAISGHYSIFDIVLPTPGFDILYPANEIADVYTEFMASDRGGGLDPFNMRRKLKDFSLSGSYRKLLGQPGQDISFDIHTYTEENEQFVQTDLDRFLLAKRQQSQKPNLLPGDASSEKLDIPQASQVDNEHAHGPEPKPEPTKLAVVLKLQLGTSQYATMALRELMKASGLKTYKPDFGGGR